MIATKKRTDDDPLLLTVAEAGVRLRLSQRMMYYLCDKGVIKTIRIGRSKRIAPIELERYVASLIK